MSKLHESSFKKKKKKIEKWNQGGVLGRSPEGSMLSVFYIPLNFFPSTTNVGGGVVVD